MIIIRFPDDATERKGLGFLATRFACKTWSNGETMVPDAALACLAREGISFFVVGPATYERFNPAPVRDPAALPVQ